jgi:hypothetical protein
MNKAVIQCRVTRLWLKDPSDFNPKQAKLMALESFLH